LLKIQNRRFWKNQHVIEADIASLSYSFAHRFSHRLLLGAKITSGLSTRISLTNSSLSSLDGYVDIVKLQLFYRYPLPKHFYFDAGPFASLGYLGDFENGYSVGIEASAMYTVWIMHIGLRMQAGWQFFKIENDLTNNFDVFITPVVIGFNF